MKRKRRRKRRRKRKRSRRRRSKKKRRQKCAFIGMLIRRNREENICIKNIYI